MLRHFIRRILVEGRVDDLKSKNPRLENEIDQLAQNDPSGRFKYLDWQVKQLKRNEPIDEVIELTNNFHRVSNRLQQKDIMGYPALGDLRQAIEELGTSKTQKKKEKKEQLDKDVDRLYEDDQVLVLYIKTSEASCHYGQGSKWCISATASRNYFSQYRQGNSFFYFIIDKTKDPAKDPLAKVALVRTKKINKQPARTTIYNAQDRTIPLNMVSKRYGDKWENIYAVIHKHLKESEDLSIEYRLSTSKDAEFLAQQAKSENPDVLKLVARNPNTPIEIVRKMYLNASSKDFRDEARQGLRYRGAETLKNFINDENPLMRSLAVESLMNAGKPYQTLAKQEALKDKDDSVRATLARITEDPEIFEKLQHDKSSAVQDAFKSNHAYKVWKFSRQEHVNSIHDIPRGYFSDFDFVKHEKLLVQATQLEPSQQKENLHFDLVAALLHSRYSREYDPKKEALAWKYFGDTKNDRAVSEFLRRAHNQERLKEMASRNMSLKTLYFLSNNKFAPVDFMVEKGMPIIKKRFFGKKIVPKDVSRLVSFLLRNKDVDLKTKKDIISGATTLKTKKIIDNIIQGREELEKLRRFLPKAAKKIYTIDDILEAAKAGNKTAFMKMVKNTEDTDALRRVAYSLMKMRGGIADDELDNLNLSPKETEIALTNAALRGGSQTQYMMLGQVGNTIYRAQNPLSSTLVRVFADHPRSGVRNLLAKKLGMQNLPVVPDDVIEKLEKDPYKPVRTSVIKGKKRVLKNRERRKKQKK